MNFVINAEQLSDGRWRGRVTFGGMAVWETLSTYLDADAAMGSAQHDLVAGVGYAIKCNLKRTAFMKTEMS
jgi:hypothetical protein